MRLSTGTKLGRYEVRSKIGAGGMGEMYLAQDTQLPKEIEKPPSPSVSCFAGSNCLLL